MNTTPATRSDCESFAEAASEVSLLMQKGDPLGIILSAVSVYPRQVNAPYYARYALVEREGQKRELRVSFPDLHSDHRGPDTQLIFSEDGSMRMTSDRAHPTAGEFALKVAQGLRHLREVLVT